MRNTTMALILIFMISVSALISGCINQEEIVSDIAYSGSDYLEALQLEQHENSLQDIERFIDPRLENLNVAINNPNIEIINLKMVDSRADESNPGWYVVIVVQNNAKTPVWITTDLIWSDNKYSYFALLDSGKRKQYNFGGLDYGPEYGISVEIYASDTVMPKISSDFVYSYRDIKYQAQDYNVPLLDFKSLKYEIDDRKRRYATFEMHNPSEFTIDGSVAIHVAGQRGDYHESGDNCEHFEIKPGETKDIQIYLRDYDPKDIGGIVITSIKQKQSNDPYRFD